MGRIPGIAATAASNVTSAREGVELVPMMDLFKISLVLYRPSTTALRIGGATSVERKKLNQ